MIFPEIMTKYFWQKLGALVLAILIWFTIYSIQHDVRFSKSFTPQTRTFVNHPIAVMKTATDTRSYKIIPDEVNVTVRGTPDIINSMTEKDIEVYVNLTDILESEKFKKKVIVSPPEGVTVLNVEPRYVTIEKID